MIEFETFQLSNGLQVIVHEDQNVQTAVINLLYDVGSRDESEDKTGFAHLFEHLMFAGSVNIPKFDEELLKVGGENNAFTSTDITNYYMTLPKPSIETGFWLESDRMLGLSFQQSVLDREKSVVIEEFKQRYLNQPYGDIWLKLRPLAYEKHPYQWPTIGKKIEHIEAATMDDVQSFFKKHYAPNRAVLVVAGNITKNEVEQLAEKWFGSIPRGSEYQRSLPAEPLQTKERFLEVHADVPADSLYLAFHMPGKFDKRYHAADLLSDILGRDKSSRLYEQLVRKKQIFNSLGAYVTGSIDPGLLVIQGKVKEKVSIEDAHKQVFEVIHGLSYNIKEEELEKVKNQALASLAFSEVEVLNRAMNLASASLSGDPGYVNSEGNQISDITLQDVYSSASTILKKENSSVMYYRSINGSK